MAAVSQVQFPDINITIMPFFIVWRQYRDPSWVSYNGLKEALFTSIFDHSTNFGTLTHSTSRLFFASVCVCVNAFSHILGGFFTWRIGRWCCATPVCKLLNTGIIISCFSPTAIFGEMSGGDSNYYFVHRRGCIQKSSSIPPAKIMRTWIGVHRPSTILKIFATF